MLAGRAVCPHPLHSVFHSHQEQLKGGSQRGGTMREEGEISSDDHESVEEISESVAEVSLAGGSGEQVTASRPSKSSPTVATDGKAGLERANSEQPAPSDAVASQTDGCIRSAAHVSLKRQLSPSASPHEGRQDVEIPKDVGSEEEAAEGRGRGGDSKHTEGVVIEAVAASHGGGEKGPKGPLPDSFDANEVLVWHGGGGDATQSDAQISKGGQTQGLSVEHPSKQKTDLCEDRPPLSQTGSRATEGAVSVDRNAPHMYDSQERERMKSLTTAGDADSILSGSHPDSVSSSPSEKSGEAAVVDPPSRESSKRQKPLLKDRSPPRTPASKKCRKTFGRKTAWKALSKKLQNRLLQKLLLEDAPRWAVLIRALKRQGKWIRGPADSLSLSVPMRMCLRSFLRKRKESMER
uniref:Uncharacterized protein n=1 Tax=Chromera velia CCMP2878 TaxID=1169474 RepID=A0A0G4I087_9ALVE|eukprot:Cvel_9885.t1-p1 / transcript=Cvel_9885.t1 / gene=Cvel_9885 / organism=Chromera_velia_CCMP2878 / gene_product=hypothetical protein / transcript_product=hypothetical protein / location=Cvel_scaffold583:29485-32286(+) / protein_length=407 / sequence_SO=supercontig / SO=protein_coding / is_pseudo=false